MSSRRSQWVAVAVTDDVRPLAAILNAIDLNKYNCPRAAFTFDEAGWQVTVEYKQILLLSAYINAGTFTEYQFNPPLDEVEGVPCKSVTIEFNLHLLVQTLDVFGGAGISRPLTFAEQHALGGRSAIGNQPTDDDEPADDDPSTTMRMTWEGPGYYPQLRLVRTESKVLHYCELNTYSWEPNLDLSFDDANMGAKFIMDSKWFREAFSEINPRCEKITFACWPDTAHGTGKHRALRVTAELDGASTTYDYPYAKDVIEVAQISDGGVNFSYRYEHMYKALTAMRNSQKTSLRIERDGLLSLQFMMPFSPSDPTQAPFANFVEFNCPALLDDL